MPNNVAIHTLVSSHWRVEVTPENGMGWLSGKARQDDRWWDVLPDCTGGAKSNDGLDVCNFLLLPYSNRIRDGKFSFEGMHYQLEHAERHAIHGVVRKLPWTVVSSTTPCFSATLDTRDFEAVNWPWPFVADTVLRLQEKQLISTLKITNKGDTAMPAGGGWHPYFVRHLQHEHPVITMPVTGFYQDTNGDCLPTGAPLPLSDELDFTGGKTLPVQQRIDHCFAGLHGPLSIQWPDSNLTLTMRCSDRMTHAILYNPNEDFFALEPVSHANDAINLAAMGIDAGIVVLQPGESWEESLVLEVGG